MKASDYIASFLVERGIGVVFGYIGGMITHLVDSLDANPNIRFIQTYHEQTAAIAAEGYAIESGKFGVAICTSGPGVTNMMTGIADAYFGSIPVLYITGQVNTYDYKYDKPIRQQGFQETNVISIVKPITKYAKLIDNAEDLVYELEKAIYIATSGRKGPVVLDLPMNISRTDINPIESHHFEPEKIKQNNAFNYSHLKDIISSSNRPMVLIGGGCAGKGLLIDDFLHRYNFPVVTTLMGRGIIDETYSNYLGMIGSYGNRNANMSVDKADLLIALGARLDTRQTGAKIDSFLNNAKIIHVDIDNNELNHNRLNNRIKVNEDVAKFIESFSSYGYEIKTDDRWLTWLTTIKNRYNQDCEIERFVDNKAPYRFMQKLNELTNDGDVITVDVGQNQMWAAQTIKLKQNQKFITSGGLAPMGFALPAAIGVAFANPSKKIYSINGDGGFHMASQSLMLISQYSLNIKVIVMNNDSLGMITQFQHLYFNDRMPATTSQGGYKVPNISKFADCYSIPYIQLRKEDLKNEVSEVITNNNCSIIEYYIPYLTMVSPKLEYDKPISKPSPMLEDGEYQEVMDIWGGVVNNYLFFLA